MSEINVCFSCDLPWKRRLDSFLADCEVVNRSAFIRQALEFYRMVLILNNPNNRPPIYDSESLKPSLPKVFTEFK